MTKIFAAAVLAAFALAAQAVTREPSRDIYDVRPAPPEPGANTLRIDLGSAKAPLAPGRIVKEFVFHVKAGGKWLDASSAPAAKNGRTVYVPLESAKGLAGIDPAAVALVRVSAWGDLTTAAAKSKTPPKGGSPAARFVAPAVGVVAPGFSRKSVRENLDAPVVFFDEKELGAIKSFSARGGRLVVANCGDPSLAAFMGVAPSNWIRFERPAMALVSVSGNVMCRYETTCGHPPSVPRGTNPLHARVVAKLHDACMRDTGLAGAIATDRGIWYAHAVPPVSMTPGVPVVPRECEVRGVWTNGQPLDPRGWDGMAERLAANGFNAVFASTDSPCFADALKACRKRGIEFHAWFVAFGHSGRSPDSAADRAAVRKEVARLFAMGVDGVELDYFRYSGGALKTAKARAEGARRLTALLNEVSADVRKIKAARKGRPAILSVAVFPVPSSQASVGQDVASWLAADLVDYVSPMCYTASERDFALQILSNGNPAKMVVGIGTCSNEARLDARQASRQMAVCKRAKLRGFALFRLDAELASRLKIPKPAKGPERPRRGR